jgi:hypothetical protein
MPQLPDITWVAGRFERVALDPLEQLLAPGSHGSLSERPAPYAPQPSFLNRASEVAAQLRWACLRSRRLLASPPGGARRLCGIKGLRDRLLAGPSARCFVVACSTANVGTNGACWTTVYRGVPPEAAKSRRAEPEVLESREVLGHVNRRSRVGSNVRDTRKRSPRLPKRRARQRDRHEDRTRVSAGRRKRLTQTIVRPRVTGEARPGTPPAARKPPVRLAARNPEPIRNAGPPPPLKSPPQDVLRTISPMPARSSASTGRHHRKGVLFYLAVIRTRRPCHRQ